MDSNLSAINFSALTQDEKNTQLLNAAWNGHTAVVERLIAAGANKEAANKDGWTALIMAAFYDRTAVVEQLIAAGAAIEAIDIYGCTALIVAAQHGHTSVVQRLIAAKANIEATNEDGYTALILAERNNHQNTAFLILRAMSPASRAAVKFGQGGCALNRCLAANPVARLAARYEAMASGFERQVCEMYQFFKHSSRSMVNPVLTIMLEYLKAEWLLNANMETEIRLASRTVRRQEKLAIKAPVPVTFRHSAAAEERKEEEGPQNKKHKPNGNR